MNGKIHDKNTDFLFQAILALETPEECYRFFDDLCAVTELRTLEQRYDVAGCLMQGKVYSEIRRETGASSAIISRVNRVLSARDSVLRQFVEESRPGPDDAAYVETYQGRQNDS